MPDVLKNLNEQQRRAVTKRDGPLLIVAGAGTGKTTVITRRIAWFIEQKLAKPDEILALTFTDKAAGEMEERVDKLLPYGYVDLWISTFHSFSERILKNHCLDIGLPADFKLLNQTEQWLLVRQNLEKFNLDYYRPLGNPTKFIHALIQHFSRCKDELVTPGDYLKYAESLRLNQDMAKECPSKTLKKRVESSLPNDANIVEIDRISELSNAYHIYNQLLLDNNALDFGDLINYTIKLFDKRPKILEKYRNQFKYILVDEFQDTNCAQYELIKLLAAPKNNLTVVADDDQSIYKFRGAAISNILEFKNDYPRAKEVFLIKNYRSAQNILDLSYQFIQLNNPNRLEVKLGLSKKLESQTAPQAVIEHLHLESQEDEARAVAEKIIEIKNSGKKASFNDFAILLRANNHAGFFVRVLESGGIPYEYLVSRGLYSKPIILDILSYLKLLDNYHESAALYRILNLPTFGIRHEDISTLTYWSKRKGRSLFLTIKEARSLGLKEETIKTLEKLLSLLEKHTSFSQSQSVSRVVLAFLEDSGYLKKLAEKDNQWSSDNFRYLTQFYKKIQSFEVGNNLRTGKHPDSIGGCSVKNFIEMINLELEAGDEGTLNMDSDDGPEAVKIMTAHSAKGLEFKYVFIVNLVDRRFPTVLRKEPIELPDGLVKEIIPLGDIHLQEERRLFYVAMTRAQEKIFFTSAEDYGGAKRKKLSRFLYELGLVKSEQFPKPPRTAGRVKETDNAGVVFLNEPNVKLLVKPPYNANYAKYHPNDAKSYEKFSFTKIKAFLTCPLQYKFMHILKVPSKSRPSFSFGQSIHTALYRFFELALQRNRTEQISFFSDAPLTRGAAKSNKKCPVSLDELLNFYKEDWIDDWYDTKEQQDEYYKKGKEALTTFYKAVQENTPEVICLEQSFNLKLDNYTIFGRIDRIDRLADGRVEIIDYKTGETKTDRKKVDKDQLLIYQMAAQDVLGEKPALLTYYHLLGNQKLSFIGSAEEIKACKNKIRNTIQEIKKSSFPPAPNEFTCKWCDYRNICENKHY